MKRLDVSLAERGLVESRELARKLVMAGAVRVGGAKAVKPSQMVAEDAALEIVREQPYVSRGGFKLEKAVSDFRLDLTGMVAIDVGASTGGFTDCMLQHGAARVYAVDVGYGQLHQKLRGDPRVAVMERTNARYLAPALFPDTPRFATVDVAFISLKLILPPLFACLAPGADIVALVKPQFEAAARLVKKGVVRDRAVHAAVLTDILTWLGDQPVTVKGLSWSPITGPKGNIEFLLHLQTGASPWETPDVESIVVRAHADVKNRIAEP